MSHVRLVPWGKHFRWGESLERLAAENNSEILLFFHESGSLGAGAEKVHQKAHGQSPFSVMQGDFSWGPGKASLAFSQVPSGGLLPIGIPANLSLPADLLQLLLSVHTIRDALDFSMALAEISWSQVIPIYFLVESVITYEDPSFLATSEEEKHWRIREILGAKFRRTRFVYTWGASPLLRSFVQSMGSGGERDGRGMASPRPPLICVARSPVPEHEQLIPKSQLEHLQRDGVPIALCSKQACGSHRVRIGDFFPREDHPWETYEILWTTEASFGEKARFSEGPKIREIWVPSRFCRGLLSEKGISVPVCEIPYGVDRSVFKPHPLDSWGFPGRFCVATLGNFASVWGWDLMLEAYQAAFVPGDPALLLLLVTRPRERESAAWHELKGRGYPALLVEVPELSLELARLLRACDFFLYPRRDGLRGLPLLQAAACGKPVAAPRAGEYPELLSGGAFFFNPGSTDVDGFSVQGIRHLLRWGFRHREDLARAGVEARCSALRWSMEESALRMRDRLRKVVLSAPDQLRPSEPVWPC